MGIIIRQSIRNSILSYVGIVLGFVNALYLYPNILTKEQLGLTQVLLAVSSIFMQFVQLGIANSTIKFYPRFKEVDGEKNPMLSLVIFVPLVGFLILLLLFPALETPLLNYYSNTNLFGRYIIYLLPLALAQVYFNVINAYLRALNLSVPGSLVNDVFLRLFIITSMVLLYFNQISFPTFMLFFTGSYLLQPVILGVYLIYLGEFKFSFNFRNHSKSLRKEFTDYSFFAFFGGISYILVNRIDIIMIGSLMGLGDAAVYTIAFYIGNVIMVPQKSINKIGPSLISEHLHKGNLNEVHNIYKKSSINQLIAGSLLFIGIWANLENLLSILPPSYSDGAGVIIVIGLARLFDMISGLNGAIILNSKYYRFNLIAIILLIALTIVTNYLLIPIYGILGAALATMASLLIYNASKFLFIWIRLGMQPFTLKNLYVILLSSAILYISLQIPRIGGIYVDIIVRSTVIPVLFATAVVGLNLSDEVTNLWKTFRKRLLS